MSPKISSFNHRARLPFRNGYGKTKCSTLEYAFKMVPAVGSEKTSEGAGDLQTSSLEKAPIPEDTLKNMKTA